MKSVRDGLVLVLSGLAVACLGVALAWVTDKATGHPFWMVIVVGSVGGIGKIAWDYRRELKSPGSLVFMGAWLIIHALVIAVLPLLGFVLWLLLMAAEMFVGFVIAQRFFNLRPGGSRRPGQSHNKPRPLDYEG